MCQIQATIYLALILVVVAVNAQGADPGVCHVQEKCGECQAAGPHCKWCRDTHFRHTRCDLRENLVNAGCQQVTTVQDAHIRVTVAEPLSRSIFLEPQRLKADLFLNRSVTFHVRLRIPEDFRRNTVTLRRARQPPSGVDVSITSDCPGSRGSGAKVTCPVTDPGDEYEFQVTLRQMECGRNTRMRLKASGITGNVRVDIPRRCICECEFYSPWASSEPDEYCNYEGETLCGLCRCYPGYSGERCECNQADTDPQCMAQGSTELCSGRGECICGQCKCHQAPSSGTVTPTRVYGRYCECNDEDCPSTDGQVCGGESRGLCGCGRCHCRDGHTGDACQLSNNTDTCLSANGMLCNGHGMCFGGTCQCHGAYSGPRCEACPACPGRCVLLKPCVQCWVFNSGPLSQEECVSRCTHLDISIVDTIDEADSGLRTCRMRDDDSTVMSYSYRDDGSSEIRVSRYKLV